MKRICIPVVSVFVIPMLVFTQTGGDVEPVRYIGDISTSNSDYKHGYHDGQMQPAIGIQNYQILRANRSHPEWSDGMGWTYNHAPMLAYWNGSFYCQYLTFPAGENIAPGVAMLTRSGDGKNWEQPRILFPIYFTANHDAAIRFHIMHHRMGFYVAPNGRLLAMGFYGVNNGYGIGRVVREIYENNEMGPVYFIRTNDNWTGEVKYPFYTSSTDQGFVEACEAFLSDKIRRMQWWEEDRFAKDKEEFYRVPWINDNGKEEPGKAFCFYTLHDSTIVGFFKNRWVTTSQDNGDTWSGPVRCTSLTYSSAKIWAQRLNNKQYALVYNPTNSLARHPLCITTSDDGIRYDQLLNVHDEVPPKRFWGKGKRPGPQYVRGIIEGNGDPPGDDLWVVYSVNKEDIWISSIPVPVKGKVNAPVTDDFNSMELGGTVTNWNIYSPLWCPVGISESPDSTENVLMLKDRDPYDYAKAVRVFQQSDLLTIRFQLYVEANPEIFEMEVVSAKGSRCVQMQIDGNGSLLVNNSVDPVSQVSEIPSCKWIQIEISINAPEERYHVRIDAKTTVENFQFAAAEKPERIIFRTGPYRLQDDVQEYKSGNEFSPGWDEPGADEPVPESVIYIKKFVVQNK
jgi:hypothetical protein